MLCRQRNQRRTMEKRTRPKKACRMEREAVSLARTTASLASSVDGLAAIPSATWAACASVRPASSSEASVPPDKIACTRPATSNASSGALARLLGLVAELGRQSFRRVKVKQREQDRHDKAARHTMKYDIRADMIMGGAMLAGSLADGIGTYLGAQANSAAACMPLWRPSMSRRAAFPAKFFTDSGRFRSV